MRLAIILIGLFVSFLAGFLLHGLLSTTTEIDRLLEEEEMRKGGRP